MNAVGQTRDNLDAFRPVLMWFWNASLNEAEIRRQIAMFEQARIREFFIHPLYGLEVPYLSDAYFDAFGVAIDEARKRGMRVWLYDEYAWPSGTAGGSVIRDHPEDRMMALWHARFELEPGEEAECAPPGNLVSAHVIQWKQTLNGIAAQAERLEALPPRWRNDSAGRVSLLVCSEQASEGLHPSARWRSDASNQRGSLDGCSPEAVRHFIDATHEAYYRRFPDAFGTVIAGSFTDEPPLNIGWVLQPIGSFTGLPWHRGLLEAFEKEMGYNLADKLHELTFPIGNYVRTRCDYWRYLTQRFENAYFRQISEWCQQHGIALTGHVNAEESLIATLLCTGDWSAALKWFHVPGIDNILSRQQLGTDASVPPAKQVSSLASQLGRERTLCETYSGSGWNTTFLDMKRILDRLAVLGVNQIQYMGGYYTMKGFRKLKPDAGWPPSHFEQNSLWPYYSHFSDYAARVCLANTQGTHAAEVAMLYPIVSAWAGFQFGHDTHMSTSTTYRRKMDCLSKTYEGMACALLEVQADYEILYEDSLARATIEDGWIRLDGGLAFSTLILPACTALRPRTLEQMEAFAASGGRLLFVNGLPTHFDTGESICVRVTRAWNMDVEATNSLVMEVIDGEVPCVLPADIIYTSANTPNVRAISTNCLQGPARAKLQEALIRELPESARVRFEPQSAALTIHCRQVEDASCVFIVNGAPESYAGRVAIPPHHAVEFYKPETDTWSAAMIEMRGEDAFATLRLAPYEAAVLRQTPGASLDTGASAPESNAFVLDGPWTVTPVSPNLLPLFASVFEEDGAPLSLEKAETLAPEQFAPCIDGRFVEGYSMGVSEGNGWGVMQGAYPLSSFVKGKAYWVRAEFDVLSAPEGMRLVTEALGQTVIALNGRPLCLSPCRDWDESNLGACVDGMLQPGRNILLMRLVMPEWEGPHALPFTALCGPFQLDAQHRIILPLPIRETGDWCGQGYPFYSGTMSYRQTFTFSGSEGVPARLIIEDAADVVELALNGIGVGVCLWPPYVFEVGKLLHPGKNDIEIRITNISSNRYMSVQDASTACPTGLTEDLRNYKPIPAGLLGALRLVW